MKQTISELERTLGDGISLVQQDKEKEQDKFQIIRRLLVQGVVTAEFDPYDDSFVGYKDRSGTIFMDEDELISCYT